MAKVKVALAQMPVVEDKEANLRTAAEYVKRAADQGAKLISLPEMFCCLYETASFIKAAEPKGERVWEALRRMAEDNKVYLVGGSMPEKEKNKLYNTCFIFGPDGNQIGRHRKVHLFDIDVKGGQYFKESDTFSAGDDITLIYTPYAKVGIVLCFDIRFIEQARILALQGAELLFAPGAFNMSTGPAHWELLYRSRALDNQVFMLGCAPARDENGPYVSYGNSLIVDPWGTVIARLDGEPGLILEEIDTDMISSVRDQLPLMDARRTDLYGVMMV
ncbi:MAG: carbon-nitrogen hydrolase family protein [Eubacterium sp.]|nr:carbon-nitrogen hydrolase family protein [Eubacterium sp.]